jgi:hypothetical protein
MPMARWRRRKRQHSGSMRWPRSGSARRCARLPPPSPALTMKVPMVQRIWCQWRRCVVPQRSHPCPCSADGAPAGSPRIPRPPDPAATAAAGRAEGRRQGRGRRLEGGGAAAAAAAAGGGTALPSPPPPWLLWLRGGGWPRRARGSPGMGHRRRQSLSPTPCPTPRARPADGLGAGGGRGPVAVLFLPGGSSVLRPPTDVAGAGCHAPVGRQGPETRAARGWCV